MANLRAFDEKSCCPKCGGSDIRSAYRPRIEDDRSWADRKWSRPIGKWPDHEFIQRSCNRCHYDWPEAVALTGSEPTP